MKKILIAGLAAGLAMLIVSLGLNQLFNAVIPGLSNEYMNPALFRPWSDPLMMLFFLHPFVVGIALSWVWSIVKSIVPGVGAWKKGFNFGLAYGIVTSLPGMLISYSSFQISLWMILSWTIAGLIQTIVAGMVLARMNRS